MFRFVPTYLQHRFSQCLVVFPTFSISHQGRTSGSDRHPQPCHGDQSPEGNPFPSLIHLLCDIRRIVPQIGEDVIGTGRTETGIIGIPPGPTQFVVTAKDTVVVIIRVGIIIGRTAGGRVV